MFCRTNSLLLPTVNLMSEAMKASMSFHRLTNRLGFYQRSLKGFGLIASVVIYTVLFSTTLVPSAIAQCPNSQQLTQIRQQRDINQSLIRTYCGDPRNSNLCAQLRTYVDNANRILASCPQNNGGNNNSGGSSNNCDALRRQITANAQSSRNQAIATLQRTRPGRNGGYSIKYRLLRTTHCGQQLAYFEPRTKFVSRHEASREIDRIANNGGLTDAVSPN